MQHHRHDLPSLGAQHRLWSIDFDVVGGGEWRQFALYELQQRDAAPASLAQELMRGGHRSDTAVQCSREVRYLRVALLRTRNDGADGGEHVFDAVVELGHQHTLVLFRSLALGDVDVDANYALRTTVVVVRREAARLDPADRAISMYDPVLRIGFSASLLPNPIALCVEPRKVLGVNAGPPDAARDLGGSLRQTVKCGVSLRHLDQFGIGVIGKAADPSRPASQCELQVALGQCQLRFLALADVKGHVDHTDHDTARVAQWRGV